MRGKRFLFFLIMIAVGLGLGLLYGWVISPVKYQNTSPDMMRADYQADYVLMVAEVYRADQNLEQASRRLALLSSLPPARVVAEAALTAKQMSFAPSDLQVIDDLGRALQKAASEPASGGQP
jgi:hypothetical protein